MIARSHGTTGEPQSRRVGRWMLRSLQLSAYTSPSWIFTAEAAQALGAHQWRTRGSLHRIDWPRAWRDITARLDDLDRTHMTYDVEEGNAS